MAEIRYEKVDDSTMAQVSETSIKITRDAALKRKDILTKSLAKINAVLAEMDKLGVTEAKTELNIT